MISKEYLKQQLISPTGHYTEILIRTYYFITQKCQQKGQDWCFSKEVPYRELKEFAYKNVGYEASLQVVKNAENDLASLGYIKFIKVNDVWTIKIIKPLDFLDEDIENYII